MLKVNNKEVTVEEFTNKLEEINEFNELRYHFMTDLRKIVKEFKDLEFKSMGLGIENNVAFIALEELAEMQEKGELIEWWTKHMKK